MRLSHPRFDDLRRFAAEGADHTPDGVAAHLAGCPRCRASVTWTRGVIEDLTRATAPAAPPSAWDGIAARVRAGDTVLLPSERQGPSRTGPWTGGLARAAMLVLALAGTAAAVVPGSPVRRWLAEAFTAPQPTATPAGGGEEAATTTTVVLPVDGPVRVSLEGPHPALRIRVRVGPPGELEVTATGAAAGARFGRSRGQLTIAEAGPGELVVVLPQGVGSAVLDVDGRALVRKEDGRLVVMAPVADTVGSELLITIGDVGVEEVRP